MDICKTGRPVRVLTRAMMAISRAIVFRFEVKSTLRAWIQATRCLSSRSGLGPFEITCEVAKAACIPAGRDHGSIKGLSSCWILAKTGPISDCVDVCSCFSCKPSLINSRVSFSSARVCRSWLSPHWRRYDDRLRETVLALASIASNSSRVKDIVTRTRSVCAVFRLIA